MPEYDSPDSRIKTPEERLKINEFFPVLIMVYAAFNVIAFLAFALDKRSAERNRRRIAERFLLASAAAGPLGALLGMKMFRHKTRKPIFCLVPAFLVLHVVVIALLVTRLYPIPW